MAIRAAHVGAGPAAAHDGVGENRVPRRQCLATHRDGRGVDRFIEGVRISGEDAALGSYERALDSLGTKPRVVDGVDHDPVTATFELWRPAEHYDLGAHRLQAEILSQRRQETVGPGARCDQYRVGR